MYTQIYYSTVTGEIKSYGTGTSSIPNGGVMPMYMSGDTFDNYLSVLDVTEFLLETNLPVNYIIDNYFVTDTNNILEYTTEQKELFTEYKSLGTNTQNIIWNPRLNQIIDNRSLQDCTDSVLLNLKNYKTSRLNSGLNYNGDIYHSDDAALTRLISAVINLPADLTNYTISWRLKNNSWATLTAENIKEVCSELQNKINGIYNTYKQHETSILLLNTKEEVLAYDITTGWD